MTNLTSINKISGDRRSFTIIGIVSEKKITKNKNLIIKMEDLTGEINVLVKHDRDCFLEGDELQLDDVVAIKCSGNREMAFVSEIIYPDAFLLDTTRFEDDVSIAFVSDTHVGSKKHLGKVIPVIIPIEPKYIWLLNESEKKEIISEAKEIIVEENGRLEFHRLSMLKDLERRTFDLDSLQKILILLESKGKEKELTKKIRKLYQMQ